jgi:hypothetical protein
VGGSVKDMPRPKIDGYACLIESVSIVWITSASTRNVTVSLHARTVAPIFRPPLEKPSESIFVNGQGPAIQETLTF